MKTVEQIAKIVSQYVNLSWPNDEENIFEILSLVQNEIWQSGKYYNSTRWFYVNTREDDTIITPHGFNVLLGLNVDFKPIQINDGYFLFHKNGPADVPLVTDKFQTSVYHLGDYPTFRNYADFCTSCEGTEKKCYNITVKGLNCGTVKEPPFTIISALDYNGRNIFTYYKDNKKNPVCVCNPEPDSQIDYINGIRFPITSNCVTYKNIKISKILNITKEPSLTPVEYYLNEVGSKNAFLIARLEPFETNVNYKVYKITNQKCVKGKCILGLFKQSKPNDITHKQEFFISDNLNAIISIAKGVQFKFKENDIQRGNAFIIDGIRALSREVKEQSPSKKPTIQMETLGPSHDLI